MKVKLKLSEPSNRLEADTNFNNGDMRDSRIQSGQKKKKRRH